LEAAHAMFAETGEDNLEERVEMVRHLIDGAIALKWLKWNDYRVQSKY
jgi:hypothetical protein